MQIDIEELDEIEPYQVIGTFLVGVVLSSVAAASLIDEAIEWPLQK